MPPQGNQIYELGLIADSEKPRPGPSLLPFDLRLQIRQREDTRRRKELAIDHPAGCRHCIAASHLTDLFTKTFKAKALFSPGGSGPEEQDTGRRGWPERPAHLHRR